VCIQGRVVISNKSAYEVLIRDCSGVMSAEDEDCFWVAFVVYVMSTLLALGAKYHYASINYWNAFEVPSLIRTYDWGQYVMH